MPARLSKWGWQWQGALLLAGGLLIGFIPLAVGYISGGSWTPELAHTPIMAFAYGAALVIIFSAVGCLMSRGWRLFGLGMAVGVAEDIVAYALLIATAAAGSY
jgi:hypothetical protein